ncbi:MAG: DUF4097 family beta strand repeat-containing protein [Planctomycetota bacterium]
MRRLMMLLCVLTACGLVGCSMGPSASEVYQMEVGGPLEIDVQNFRGDVILKADPRRDIAEVKMVRRGEHGFDRGDEARASLASIDTSVSLVPGELGQRLQIRTNTTHVEPNFQSVDIHIDVPEIDGVRILTDDGDVVAIRAEGEVDIQTSNGNVQVKTRVPMTKPVTIINNGGGIAYLTRSESTARFDAKVVNGSIYHHVNRGDLRIFSDTNDESFQAQLNNGANSVILRTVDGPIRIEVVAQPEMVYSRLLYDS